MEDGAVMSAAAAPAGPAVDPSMLECNICLALIGEPVTISCGHSFCRSCLERCLSRTSKRCPTCRAVCHLTSPSAAPENAMLRSLATALFPAEYQARLAEVAGLRNAAPLTLPIFFYNDTRLPGARIGLNLFEPRYRVMMQRIVSADRKFCYLPNFTDYTARTGDVGLVAELTECEQLANGQWSLVAKLTNRVVVNETWVEGGTGQLHYAELGLLEDTEPSGAEAAEIERFLDGISRCVQTMERLAPQMLSGIQGSAPPRSQPGQISFFYGLYLENYGILDGTDTRELLAMTSVRARLAYVHDVLTELVEVGIQRSAGPQAPAASPGSAEADEHRAARARLRAEAVAAGAGEHDLDQAHELAQGGGLGDTDADDANAHVNGHGGHPGC